MLNSGFAQEIITPKRGISLAGYFNERPNRGAYDEVKVKALLFNDGQTTAGFIVYDLCELPVWYIERTIAAIAAAGVEFADNLSISCTHTHTSADFMFANLPYAELSPALKEYVDGTIAATVRAVSRAAANLAPATLEYASKEANPYAFVRRYWMENGSVVTNPGKLNPRIVKPESEMDRRLSVVAVRQEGRLMALMVNVANHGDTIGGDFVSGDWYGRMEQEIQYHLTEDVPVLTFDDASGDINHFDTTTARDQTSYAEAVRIGRGYGEIVLGMLNELEKLEAGPITVKRSGFDMFYRTVTEQELADAKAYIAAHPQQGNTSEEDLTSEGLANGDPAILCFFANRTLECAGNAGRAPEHARLLAIFFGNELVFSTLPGECFNGIAQELRKNSPCKRHIVITLAMGIIGYFPMAECYPRGGYETQPEKNSPAADTAPRLIKAASELLKQ